MQSFRSQEDPRQNNQNINLDLSDYDIELPQPGFEESAKINLRSKRQYKEGLKVLAAKAASEVLGIPDETFICFDGRPSNAAEKLSIFNLELRRQRRDEFYLCDSRVLNLKSDNEADSIYQTNLCLVQCRIVDTGHGLIPLITSYKSHDDSGKRIAHAIETKLTTEVSLDEMKKIRRELLQKDSGNQKNKIIENKFKSLNKEISKRYLAYKSNNNIQFALYLLVTTSVILLIKKGIDVHIQDLQVERSTQLKRLVDLWYQTKQSEVESVYKSSIQQVDQDMVNALHGELWNAPFKRKQEAIAYFEKWSLAEGKEPRAFRINDFIYLNTGPRYGVSELTSFIQIEKNPLLINEATYAIDRLKVEAEKIEAIERKNSIDKMYTTLDSYQSAKTDAAKEEILLTIEKNTYDFWVLHLNAENPKDRIQAAKILSLFGSEWQRLKMGLKSRAYNNSDHYVQFLKPLFTDCLLKEKDQAVRNEFNQGLDKLWSSK